MILKEIINYTSDGSCIYVPSPEDNPIEHVISLRDTNINIVKLYNSDKGITSKLDYVFIDDKTIKVAISFNDTQGETMDVIMTDKESLSISCKFIKKTTRLFKDFSNKIVNIDSNLMSLRSRLAMPNWSTAFKNDYSVSNKILSTFHNVFSTTYNKFNKLLFNDDSNFTSVPVYKKPDIVIRSDGKVLRETLNIFSSYKEMKKVNGFTNNYINKFVIKETSDFKTIDEINTILPKQLYLTSNTYSEVTIKGIDKDGNNLIVSYLVTSDIPQKINESFSYISDILFSESIISITDYIDLSNNHYVIDDISSVPPIIGQYGNLFHPYLFTDEYNLFISDPYTRYKYEPLYKFVNDSIITSAYLTVDLDLIYTTIDTLVYTKLTKNMETKILDNTSNNNKFISVSDTEANIDDWLDITVKVKDWVQYSNDESFVIQLKNEDKILYFDVVNNSISNTPVFLYSSNLKDTITFSVSIENNDPYVVTLLSSDLKLKSSAHSIIESLVPYKTIPIDSGSTLFLYDGDLVLSNKKLDYDVVNTLGNEDNNLILTLPEDTTYTIDINNYILTNSGDNTLPDRVYELLDDNIIELNLNEVNLLGDLKLKIDSEYSDVTIYLNNDRQTIKTNNYYVIGE